jgi:hypothetical protein
VVHLSGALGQRAWVLTPYIAEWRYGDNGDGMDWYPSVRLFRQAQLHDWTDVVQNMAAQLDII